MAHPNEELLRNAYAAFARGDLEGYWAVCAQDFTFHVPGQNQVTGTYQGMEWFWRSTGLNAIVDRKSIEQPTFTTSTMASWLSVGSSLKIHQSSMMPGGSIPDTGIEAATPLR